MKSENNRVGQPEIVVNSGVSEHLASDELYLTDIWAVTPVTVELANSTSLTATRKRIAEQDVKKLRKMFCRAECISEIKLNLPSSSRIENHGVTTTLGLGKCKTVDRV